jgi:hypothetical protein
MMIGSTMNASVSQPVDDRRHAREIHDREAQKLDELSVRGVFAQVDRADDTEHERDHHRTDHQQDRTDDVREDAACGIDVGFDAYPLQLGFVRGFEFPEFGVAHLLFRAVQLEHIEGFRRLRQERHINERRRRLEDHPAALDADVEEDDGGTQQHEVGRGAQQPEDAALRAFRRGGLGEEPLGRRGGGSVHVSRRRCGSGARSFARAS